MYNPEAGRAVLAENIGLSLETTNETITRGWMPGRASRLIATTLLAGTAMIAVSAEAEHVETQGGSAPNANTRGAHCGYMPNTHHSAAATGPTTAKKVGQKMVAKCFGGGEWWAAKELWDKESGWDPMAVNPGSKACGIVQAAPCNKMTNCLKCTTVEQQLSWGIDYIDDRYGTPTAALKFWKERHPINGRDVGNWY